MLRWRQLWHMGSDVACGWRLLGCPSARLVLLPWGGQLSVSETVRRGPDGFKFIL